MSAAMSSGASLNGMDILEKALLVADEQCLVAHRRQLYRAGVPRWFVRNELRRRRWQSTGPQTVALHNGPLDQPARWWVAVLETGRGAALDGVCALQAAGIKGLRDVDIDVAAAKSSTPAKPRGVRVRETRRFRREDVITTGIPRMRPAVAAVHAALWAHSDRQAKLFVVMTVQQRLASVTAVAHVVAGIRRDRRRLLLHELVAELAAGAQSLGELDVVGALRRRGLPPPSRQSIRERADGTQYLDLEWPEFRLVLEIDGVGHEEAVQALSDVLRDVALIAEGSDVIRLKSVAWALNRDAVLDALEDLFRARGWVPAAA